MPIYDDDDYLDFSSTDEEETLKLPSVARVPRPAIPKRATTSLSDTFQLPRIPKKMQLERLTITGTTSVVLQAIKRVNEYPPEYFAQAYNRQTLTAPIPIVPLAPRPETRAIPEAEPETSRSGILALLNLKKVYTHIMTDELYRNSIFTMASTFLLGGLGFVFWIIAARLYQTEMVGVATTLISIISLLSGFTNLGLNVSLNRYIPKSTNRNQLISSSFMLVMLVTIVVSAIFLLGLPVFSPQLLFLRSNAFYAISFTIFIICFTWNTMLESTFMAFRAAGNILIKNIIISLSKIILPFVLVAFGAYGVFMSVSVALSLGVFAAVIMLILNFKVKPSLAINFSLIKETAAFSFANYVSSFMFYMPSLVLPVLVFNALGAQYSAYYYVASMIQSILEIIPLAAAQALLTEGSYNEADLKKHVKKAFTTVLVILVPAILVIVFAGNILLMLFGKSYATEAFQFLRLYSISTICSALNLISNALMNVKHQIKTLLVWNVIAALLTLGLSYLFISDKLVGVGLGWLLGQTIVGLVSLFFIARNYSSAPEPGQRIPTGPQEFYHSSSINSTGSLSALASSRK